MVALPILKIGNYLQIHHEIMKNQSKKNKLADLTGLFMFSVVNSKKKK